MYNYSLYAKYTVNTRNLEKILPCSWGLNRKSRGAILAEVHSFTHPELSRPLIHFFIAVFYASNLVIPILYHLLNVRDPDPKDLSQDLLGDLEFQNPSLHSSS